MNNTLENYLQTHPKKYLIFDLDSTLARLKIDWTTFRRDIFDLVAIFDKQLTEEVPFVPFAGLELANRAIKLHGEHAKNTINSFVERYELTHYSGYTPNPELLSFIRSQKEKYKLYIWTSNMRKTIMEFLKNELLESSFSKIVCREDVTFLKPDREGFKQIQIGGSNPNEYLMIGDNFTDEGAAKNAGIDFFIIDYFSH